MVQLTNPNRLLTVTFYIDDSIMIPQYEYRVLVI